ncbi:hypothetical protein GMD83_10675 [Pseudoflavonifractor sp. BIOML-A7]|nr:MULTISPECIES: hypothetical protein [unclassified Pseudoflavonifractor]MTR46249.1 hypothetical protein [Pseudoflavonifractor sp. BIOML-A13]MTS61046.1 hypothetical protein [Pseudoflavonifractor sp. BIOML-A7]MTS90219.1 hypothetical protein [Pseudoflavonifractor sp. BIOML-A4]MTS95483.1 hypothetical protein [Pseudoflavonifractor sp. BIOML-A1]MTR36534.1 hypothetical protein [Pseudoflavonifractor sp. BIOML-A9]
MTNLTTLVGNVFTTITSNAYLSLFLAASLLGLGIGLFRKFKKSAR